MTRGGRPKPNQAEAAVPSSDGEIHKSSRILALLITIGVGIAALAFPAAAQTDPLPSCNEGASKQAIRDFVAQVTAEGGPGYVPPAERIAPFDNDGTLWAEQPIYFQLAFALDRVKAGARTSRMEGEGAVLLPSQG